eukprot:gene20637-44256_t
MCRDPKKVAGVRTCYPVTQGSASSPRFLPHMPDIALSHRATCALQCARKIINVVIKKGKDHRRLDKLERPLHSAVLDILILYACKCQGGNCPTTFDAAYECHARACAAAPRVARRARYTASQLSSLSPSRAARVANDDDDADAMTKSDFASNPASPVYGMDAEASELSPAQTDELLHGGWTT